MKAWLVLLLLFAVFSSPALAVDTVRLDDTTIFEYTVQDDDHLISSVNLNDVPQNSNVTVYLDAYGELYRLDVNNSFSGYGGTGWWTFDITLTSPNGTISTLQKKELYPYAKDADIKIQYFYRQLDAIWDVDIYLGLNPLDAHFESPVQFMSGSVPLPNVYPDAYDGEFAMIAFYSVYGSSSAPVDFVAYVSDLEEWEGQQNDSWLEQLKGSAETTLEYAFGWAWNNVLAFIGKIPVIGPYLEISLTMAGMIFSEIAFYFNLLIIENWYIFFMVIETIILGDAIMNTKTFWKLLERTWNDHVYAFKLAAGIFGFLINMWTKLVQTIAQIVQALKPT